MDPQTGPQTLVLKASRVLFGTPPVFASSSQHLYQRFNINPLSSVILALKDYDREVPAAVYHLDGIPANSEVAQQRLSDWVFFLSFQCVAQVRI